MSRRVRSTDRQRPRCGQESKRVLMAMTLALLVWLLPAKGGANPAPAPNPVEQRVLFQAQQQVAAKKYAEAQQMLMQFISEKGEKVHYLVFFALGNALALQGRHDAALHQYRQAAAQNGTDAALWLNMGKVCYDLQQFGQAAQDLQKAYELMTEKKPELLYQAAVCFLQDQKPQQALACLSAICITDAAGTRDEWFEALVEVHLKLGQHRQAVATVQHLLVRPEPKPRWWKLLAHVHVQAHDYAAAAAAFKVYLELAAPSREEVIRLGDLYRLAGVPLKAARQYEKALQWPAAEGDYEKIASVYLSAHRPDMAVQALHQAIASKPSARLWHMLGSIQYNQGKYQEAREAFRQSHELAQGDGSALLLMGYCDLKLNNLHEAAEAFESASRFSQQRTAAQKALHAIEPSAHREAKQ
jgi:tetratricopeptide (TPR) repeat protein